MQNDFNVSFDQELKRVMFTVCYYCGYKDKGEKDEALMRAKRMKN
jgi:hypothetical protein